ncbi:MAG: Ig-like domain-containing protein, partial [Rhodanobacter sp.]
MTDGSGAVRAQRAVRLLGWRWLVALLLLLTGFSGQTWAVCVSPVNVTVASGGSVMIKCAGDDASFAGWGNDTIPPMHGTDTTTGPDFTGPGSINWLKYTNDGTGTTDTFTTPAYRGHGPEPVVFNVTITGGATVPGVPTIGTATAGSALAKVAFTAPASDGGSPITGYTVTSNPDAVTGTCASSPCTVLSLTNGTSYTFTVKATNAIGTGVASAPSNSVTPLAPPVANNVIATVAFNSTNNPITLNLGGGTATSVAVASSAAHGTATASGTSITYTPTSGYSGSDGFTYTATNGSGTSSAATISVTVGTPAAPTVANKSVSTPYNTPASINLAGSITGAGITSISASTPTHGTVSVSGETVTYTPSSTYYGGTDSFTYTAENAGGVSTAATVTITVGTPSVPTVADKSVTTAYNTPTLIDLSSSITGAGITSISASTPTHGTVSVSGETVTYTPSSTYYGGTDSFTYTAENAGGVSTAATVTITVGLPAIPTVAAKSVSTPYNTAASIDLSGSITGAGITAISTSAPTHGTVSVSGETVTYTPSATYYGGADSFTYMATNAGGTSAPATVSITVGLPAAPTAAAKAVSTPYNTAASIDLTSSITGTGITG